MKALNHPVRMPPRSLAVLFTLLLSVCLGLSTATADEEAEKLIHEQAMAAMKSGEYDRARSILEADLKEKTNDPYLLYNVALTHYAQKNYDLAQQTFQQADLEAKTDELRALILAQLGNIESHRGRSKLDENRNLTIDHFRRAHQLYQSSLTTDAGQDIARANSGPNKKVLVELFVVRAEEQINIARTSRKIAERIDQLTTTRSELEESLQLESEHRRAKELKAIVDELLVENLTELGDEKFEEAKGVMNARGAMSAKEAMEAKGAKEAKGDGDKKLNDALAAVQQAENVFRDALVIKPESEPLEEKLDKATKLSSEILTQLGKDKLAHAEKEIRQPQQMQRLEEAVGNFDQALAADPENKEAAELKEKTEALMAENFEASGDASVASAEAKGDRTKAELTDRERADEAYTNAVALNPNDAELQEKRKDNALKLAENLEEVGQDQLEEGKSLIAENPDKAVGTLESALNDFTQGSELLAEHGEEATGAKAGAEEAEELLAGQAASEPGERKDGTEPGEGGPEEGAAVAAAEPGKGAAKGSEPGAEPGKPAPGKGPPGQGPPGSPPPAGSGMAARLEQSAQQTMALLAEARAAAAAMAPAVESVAQKGGTGQPTYETVAYVMQGGDFDNEAGGGSKEREGNFNTEIMNRPTRDW